MNRTTRLGTNALVALVLTTSPGCSPQDAPGPTVTRSDSAGVAVVFSSAPREYRTVSERASLSIGLVSGEPEYLLADVYDALRLSDGRVVVANCFPPILRWYDRNGEYVTGTGRDGGGPGEFREGVCGRTIEVHSVDGVRVETWEHHLGRIQVFDSAGNYESTFTMRPADLGGGGSLVGHFDAGYLLAYRRGFEQPGYTAGTSWRDTLELHVFSTDGEHERLLAKSPGATFIQFEVETAFGVIRNPSVVPFAPIGLATAWHETAVLAPGEQPELRVLDRSGSLEMLIRWSDEQQPVTRRLIDAYIEERFGGPNDGGRRPQLPDYPYPDRVHPYNRILTGADGLLWVRRPRVPGSLAYVWLGFDQTGEWAAQLEVPRAWEIFEIGDAHILARVSDALGVESVVMHELVVTGGP